MSNFSNRSLAAPRTVFGQRSGSVPTKFELAKIKEEQRDAEWSAKFEEAKKNKEETGRWTGKSRALDSWISTTRANFRKLSPEKIKALRAAEFPFKAEPQRSHSKGGEIDQLIALHKRQQNGETLTQEELVTYRRGINKMRGRPSLGKATQIALGIDK